MKSDDTNTPADPFTPGTPPAEPEIKDRSGLYIALILVVAALIAAVMHYQS